MQRQFYDKRLGVARLLAKQQGRTWGGLSSEESGKLIDAAGAAVRLAEDALAVPVPASA